MAELTIDICILRSGSGIGNTKYYESSNSFMRRFLEIDTLYLALDERGRIRHQYDTQLKEGIFGHHWLSRMADRDRIAMIPWQRIDRGTRTALQEAHFDPEDFKYVETSAATDTKTISTHDPDYTRRVCRILRRRLEVEVVGPQECMENFCT